MYIHVYKCIYIYTSIHVYTCISTHKSQNVVPNLFKTLVLSSQTTKIKVLEPNIDQEDAADPILRVPGVNNGVRGPENKNKKIRKFRKCLESFFEASKPRKSISES